ncbi:MAG: hypothetical protein MRJ65_16775 [Candidatus Brocadiaceae bacterium]|nr:hypothetical protein [Candidatus Brocadiaceae bacterium]
MRICLVFLVVGFFSPYFKACASEDLLILFSGEELGSLEPCGCFEGQIGGISRRYSLVEYYRKQKKQVVPISLGDMPKGVGRQDEIKMDILSRALGEMGYALHNLGEKDLEIDLQVLSYLSHTNNVNFLSSNVEITSDFAVRTNKYIVKEYFVSGISIKIAFLGIISQAFVNNSNSEYVNIHDPAESITSFIKKLKDDEIDLIVLLAHASQEESVDLAKLFPEIELIITGHLVDMPQDSPFFVNNTLIVSPGTGGKYMGVVKYTVNNKRLERQSAEIVPLDTNYEDSNVMLALLKEYQQMLREEDLLSTMPQTPLSHGLTYVNSQICGACHKIIYNHWLKTGHATAYHTLVKVEHQYDPECIKCHVVGYGYISGFVNYEKSANLSDVGCESCHGAGSEHINNLNSKYESIGKPGCNVCHDYEHSPKFQYDEYWKRIKHPKETVKKNNR